MRAISPEYASLLTVIGDNPRMPTVMFRRLTRKIKSRYVRKIALALRELRSGRPYSQKYSREQLNHVQVIQRYFQMIEREAAKDRERLLEEYHRLQRLVT